MVFILDALDGEQLGPLEVVIGPDEGEDKRDGQRNERGRNVAVQTRERLA